VDLDETLYVGDCIQYYLDTELHNSVASTISKQGKFKFETDATFNRLLDLDKILHWGDGIIYISSTTCYLIPDI
jgi:hypothetical protein